MRGRDDVLRLEVLLGVDAELRLGQVAHVPHRRLDDVLAVQILLDRLHLRRRLDDHQRTLRHYRSPRPRADRDPPLACELAGPSRQLRVISAVRRRRGVEPARAISRSMCCGSSTLSAASMRASSLPAAGPPRVCRPDRGARQRRATAQVILARHPSSARTSIAPSRRSPWGPRLAARRDSAWNGEHFAPEIARQARGDQGPAALGRLHHHHAERQPGERPVARRKVVGRAARSRAGTARRARRADRSRRASARFSGG